MHTAPQLKFVIVGHVDHGKSTLIGRLLYDTDSLASDKIEELKKSSAALGRETEFAYLLDHLEEERQQGITIDTTQVFFRTEKREYVIIDAPGHREFVKNMITGASQAEAAVLIVDVNEGVKEQTQRHAYILSLLGLTQVMVVVNKMDLVGYDQHKFLEVAKAVEAFLKTIAIRPRYCLPISALKGENIARQAASMKWFEGPTFLQTLDALSSREASENKPLLFPIQDVYETAGKKIAVGRVEAGQIEKGQQVSILPRGGTTSVRTIEKFPESVELARAGESIGITWDEPPALARGDVLCNPGEEPATSDRFPANIIWLSPEPLARGDSLWVRCATQEATGRVARIMKRIDSSSLQVLQEDAEELHNLEVGEVIIETDAPLVITSFNAVAELGRFVLLKEATISAGGIILDKG